MSDQIPSQPDPGSLPPSSYSAPPAGPLTPSQERQWATLAHVIAGAAMVFSAGFAGFVGALVVYVMYKDRGPFVRAHAANAVNVQISAGVFVALGWILTVTVIGALVGIPMLLLAGVYAVVCHVIGALKANAGEFWDPPFTFRFVS